jgi:DNA invertase Pin-like site-specific DNA recombinase
MSPRKIAPSPTVAIAYLRVSTDEQTLGMDAQRSAISAWAAREGVTVAAWCEDMGVSGGAQMEDRPGLVEALRLVRELHAGRLVAHKADRIARDVYVAELVKRELRATSVALALVEGICGDDPFSEMAATIMDAAARMERRMIAARTRAALAEKRVRGERISGCLPYGFQLAADGVHLEPHLKEQKVIERICQLRKEGMGGRRIATILTEEGFKPRGIRWNP